eukprot:TRINITY_DN22387_c0_g1_i1.p1 TRINITY_DN22387_c0_g1~~TRINITY_DN22387_c0_g1_i1.p1  ORF type:complete len:300 (-),score=35.13 TRINITY_DN22387_c0_g1_i1:83-853(-)
MGLGKDVLRYPVTIFNALITSKDMRSMLWPLLNDMDDGALLDLLNLRKQKIVNMTASQKLHYPLLDMNASARRDSKRFEFVPCPELGKDGLSEALCNVDGNSTQKLRPYLTAYESALLFCVKHMLRSVYKSSKKLFIFLTWLQNNWPGINDMFNQITFVLDPREANLALRFVFILLSQVDAVTTSVVTTTNFEAYRLWQDYCELANDIVTHLAVTLSKGLKEGKYKVKEVRNPLLLLKRYSMHTLQSLILTHSLNQ